MIDFVLTLPTMDHEEGPTDELPSPSPVSNNITAEEIDQETATKLRGDAIGNTMYSEVFVLNTLLQFSDLKWDKEVEDNLCFLWDMTEEKDVCQLLFKISYPKLACSAITNYNEPRFVEIVVGIFANLLCSKCEKTVNEDEIKAVLNLLSSDDPYILIQVVRFVHAVSFMFDKLDFIDGEHLDKLDFILYNSTNKELLMVTLKTVVSITDSCKINGSILKAQLLKSVVTAYKALKDLNCETELEMFESFEHCLNVKHLIQFMCNVCSYVQKFDLNALANQLNSNLRGFINEMASILNYFKIEDNLLPVDDQFKFYMEALTYIYRLLAVGYISPIARPLYEIYFILSEKDTTNLETVAELVCYFISVGTKESLEADFHNLSCDNVKKLLLNIEKNACTFEFNYMENVGELLKC